MKCFLELGLGSLCARGSAGGSSAVRKQRVHEPPSGREVFHSDGVWGIDVEQSGEYPSVPASAVRWTH